MRNAEIARQTGETDIKLSINLDGSGVSSIDTGVGFLDHMLTLFAKHGHFDLRVKCVGDTYVDAHHSVEDIGICLGKAFCTALSDKKGINRYADTTLPMDESLILSAVDVSGRGECYYALNIVMQKVGDFDTELCEEFFHAFATNAGITLHLRQISGSNAHHIIEGAFKSVAHSLEKAVSINAKYLNEVPSTKGVL